jgi:hypothetical protein
MADSFTTACRAHALDGRDAMQLRMMMSPSECQALERAPAPRTPMKRLLLSVDKLRANPYARERLGESEEDPVRARDWMRALLGQPESDAERRRFCAWMVFERRKSEVYVTRDIAMAMSRAWGCDPGDALVPHPTRAGVVTCLDLHFAQLSVRRLVTGAVAVCEGVELAPGGVLDAAQRAVADGIMATPFAALQGPAGTGKTTVLSAIMVAAVSEGTDVRCLAPTHKAKNNLKLKIPATVPCSTIHSFVKRKPAALPPTFFVIDEGSMVDLELLSEFATIVMRDCERWQVVIAGDVGQLEPVGRGECFRRAVDQLGASGELFALDKCYRTSFETLFAAQASIRNGRVPAPAEGVVDVPTLGSDKAVWDEVRRLVSAHGGDVQYIAWQNAHCSTINGIVQQKAQGKAVCMAFEKGDRVVYVGANKPNDGMTNAMTGSVRSTTRNMRSASVFWEDGVARTVRADDLQLAYCITVHKAQGSEFADVCVVALALDSMKRSLDRRWLYTAGTRAKDRLRILAPPGLDDIVATPTKKQSLMALAFGA